MLAEDHEKLCLRETNCSVTSISTVDYVPQPVDEKSHFIRNRIFVGNFPNSATHKDISNIFRPFGEIIETNIVESPNSTNRYAFVTFRFIASTDAVLSLYFRGREFSIKGQAVNINRALFKPKRQSTVKGVPPSNFAKAESIIVRGGRAVVAEFVNGMVYFKPLKESAKPGFNSVFSAEKVCPSFPPIPCYALANHFRLPIPINVQSGFPLLAYPSMMPRPPVAVPLPSYSCPNLQTFTQPPPPPPPSASGLFMQNPCFGSLPVIR